MIRREDGFSLTELMITMVVFVFVIAAASQVFTGLLSQYKQQSKIAETNIEGVVGLDILRRDIEHGGYGLPWDLNGATYREIGAPLTTPDWTDHDFSDGPPTNPARAGAPPTYPADAAGASNPPAAFRSGDGAGTGGSDVLVIKATTIASNNASQKWTYINPGNTVKEWDREQERMETSDRVIVLTLGATRRLESAGGTFTALYQRVGVYGDASPDTLNNASFAPPDDTEVRVTYGVSNPANPVATPLRMPFNRADYYMRIPTATPMPTRCATGTGMLYKATVSQAPLPGTADATAELPLLDCVADMQVQYFRDTDGDGTVDNTGGDISALTAAQIRDQVKEVRVSILAHEGQREPNFTFTGFTGVATCATCIRVGTNAVDGRDFDLLTITDSSRLNYRWKVYTIAVQPVNLR
jgi:prepilin-type N-terminal cleavage/methylation domain-containing protein